MKKRVLTDEQEAKLASEYVAGATCEALAVKYGCSHGTIQNALRRQQVPRRSRQESSAARKVLTQEQERALAEEYQTGLSMEVLASKFSCSPVTVRNILIRLGVPRRPCGKRSNPIKPTKVCSSCGDDLPRKSFSGDGKKTSECRACLSQKQAGKYEADEVFRQKKKDLSREWRLAHPQKARAHKRLWASGWTQERFDIAWSSQDGKCAACGNPMRPDGTKWDSVCADHDHESGRPRGLLCRRCNIDLGVFEKKRSIFEQYLDRFQELDRVES